MQTASQPACCVGTAPVFQRWCFNCVAACFTTGSSAHTVVVVARFWCRRSTQTPFLRKVKLYETSVWRGMDMSLLEFLRKTNEHGNIAGCLQEEWRQSNSEMGLQTYANQFEMQGQKVVACTMVSRLKDCFYGQWLLLHVPFNTVKELWNQHVVDHVPQTDKCLALCLTCTHPVAQAMRQHPEAIDEDMLIEGRTQLHRKMVLDYVAVQSRLVFQYLSGSLPLPPVCANVQHARQHHVLPIKDKYLRQIKDGTKWIEGRLNKGAAATIQVNDLVSFQDFTVKVVALYHYRSFEEMLEDLGFRSAIPSAAASETRRPRSRTRSGNSVATSFCGKASVAVAAVKAAANAGAQVLWAVYTAQLAARTKPRLPPGAAVETCHAAFGFGQELSECGYNLVAYSLVIVDEFSQLEAWHLDHLEKLRNNISNCVAFGLVGDPFQCPGFGERRVWESPLWLCAVQRTRLHQIYRCVDPEFQKVLSVLRTAKPTSTGSRGTLTAQQIMKGRRAWYGHTPTVDDVQRLLQKFPHTAFMAITRRGAAHLSDLATQALFGHLEPMAVLPADVESNPENYDDNGALKAHNELVPLQLTCYQGMKVFLTRNVDKTRDYINGMGATIETYDCYSRVLIVMTDTGHRIPIRPWTDSKLSNAVYHPMRAGYASTVLKLAGAELDHVVLWLDAQYVPGAAYTAMSRVRCGKDLLTGGKMTPHHFTPVKT
eukprot:s916_g30.t1